MSYQEGRPEGVQYSIGKEQRTIPYISRKNEAAGPKQKQCSAMDVSGGESKAWYCKEQYCLETWNDRSMNQGKLNMVKQEMARLNTTSQESVNWNGQEWINLIQMTIIPTTVNKNSLEKKE